MSEHRDEEEVTYVNGKYQVNPKGGPPPLPTNLPTPRANRASMYATTKSEGSVPSMTKSNGPFNLQLPHHTQSDNISFLTPTFHKKKPSTDTKKKGGISSERPRRNGLDRASALIFSPLQDFNMLSAVPDPVWESENNNGSVTERGGPKPRQKLNDIVEGSVTPRAGKSTDQHRSPISPSESFTATPIRHREKVFNRSITDAFRIDDKKGGIFAGWGMSPDQKKQTEIERNDREYAKYLEMAKKENFDNIENSKMVYRSGYDSEKRPIIVILAPLIPVKTIDMDKLLLYFIKVLDTLVENDYVIIYVHNNSNENIPKFAWLKKSYSILSRKYKKNLKSLYIVQPTALLKGVMKLFKPFISSKFWRKLQYIDEIKEIYNQMSPKQFMLPLEILTSNRGSTKSLKPEIFGVSLEETMKHPMNLYTPIPLIVLKCIKYLKNGIQTEGLFRLSGRAQRIEELKDAFDRGEVIDFSSEQDTHAIAGLLKLYFRKMPDPLCSYHMYREWITSYNHADIEGTKIKLDALIKKLPLTNYLTLSSLLDLLHLTSEASETTKMTAPNLAICWAPNILRPKEESLSNALLEANSINNIVATLISNFKYFFPAGVVVNQTDEENYTDTKTSTEIKNDVDKNPESPITDIDRSISGHYIQKSDFERGKGKQSGTIQEEESENQV
jgi:Rho GTPase-activating protein 1